MPSTTGLVPQPSSIPACDNATTPCANAAILTTEPCAPSAIACAPSPAPCCVTLRSMTRNATIRTGKALTNPPRSAPERSSALQPAPQQQSSSNHAPAPDTNTHLCSNPFANGWGVPYPASATRDLAPSAGAAQPQRKLVPLHRRLAGARALQDFERFANVAAGGALAKKVLGAEGRQLL